MDINEFLKTADLNFTNMDFEKYLEDQRILKLAKQAELIKILDSGEIKEWADKLTADGHELKMTWDGGGDSGWVNFLIDDEEATSNEDQDKINILIEICYEELDYGSWAGEFSATGEVVYDSDTKSFSGTDYYSEDDSLPINEEVEIVIPKDIWFDSVEISIQDEEINVSSDLIVKNGFKTEAHKKAEEALEEHVRMQVDLIVSNFQSNHDEGYEYRSMWDEINLSKSDFTLKGDNMVATVDSLSIGVYKESEREIFINLNNED